MMFSAIKKPTLLFGCIKRPRLPHIRTALLCYAQLEAGSEKTVSPGLRFSNGFIS